MLTNRRSEGALNRRDAGDGLDVVHAVSSRVLGAFTKQDR
jgi:hypothetical protein